MFLKQFALAAQLLITTMLVQAAIMTFPKFSIIPILKVPTQLPLNGVGIAQYLIVNNTALQRTLTMVPRLGINQITAGGGCNYPFILAPGQSCLLNLQIIASQLFGGLHSGPEVCKTMGPGDNRPDPFLCSQPYPADQLHMDVLFAIN